MNTSRPLIIQRAIKLVLLAMPLAVLGNILFTLWTSGNSGLRSLLNIPFHWILLALLFSLFPWIFAFFRLAVWSRFFKLGLGARSLAEIVLANDLAAAATPTAMGGGYAKIGLLLYHRVKPGLAASLMVIGSIEDYVSMALVVPICWLLFPPEHIQFGELLGKLLSTASTISDLLPVTVLTVSSAAVFVWAIPATRSIALKVFSFKWIREKIIRPLQKIIADFKGAFYLISKGGKLLFLLNVSLAALQWIMRYSIFTFIAAGLGLNPHPVVFFLLQWLVFMFMNVVPTPGAIGGAEVVFALVFKGVIPGELLAVASGAWRMVSTYLQLIIGALIMILLEKPAFRKR